ncbi:MAG: DEAD/DEAH box helicase, partial [Mariprofundaceae bacterium]
MHEIPEISEEMIWQWLGETYAQRGKAYFNRGQVIELDEMDDAVGIYSRVDGNAAHPYETEIKFEKKHSMSSRCSCPIRSDCKHVAATLYALMDEQAEAENDVVPHAFAQWLGTLEKVNQGKQPVLSYPDSVKQRLLYILESDKGRDVRLKFLSTRTLKNGGYGKAKEYNPANVLNYSVPAFVLAVDEKILKEVALDRSLGSMRGFKLKGEEGLSILKRALMTGRCHWQNERAPALKLGEKRVGKWLWQVDSQGVQQLGLDVDEMTQLILTAPPWYLDAKQSVCGVIESGQVADVAELLLNMPAIDLDCPDDTLQTIAERLPKGIPAPIQLQHEQRQVEPVALLQLTTLKFSHAARHLPDHCHVAEVVFDYDGHLIPWSNRQESTVRSVSGNRVLSFERAHRIEAETLEMIASAGLSPLQDNYIRNAFDFPEHFFTLEKDEWWPEWMLHEIPHLKAQGIRVEISETFSFKIEQAKAWHLNFEQAVSGSLMGQTSFAVTLNDGEEVDLIDALARWVGEKPEMLQEEALGELKEQEKIALPLSDGRMLEAPGIMIANILYYMLDLFASDKQDTALLSAPQMLALEDSLNQIGDQLNLPVQISSSAWLQHMRQLTHIDKIPICEPPKQLKAELRDYQREGLNWMQFLCEMQLNGILADDMGLGKTVQALAHLLKEKEQRRMEHPALVIAPTSLMHNWRREIEKFTPALSVLVLHGPDRACHYDHLTEYDLVLTTYPLLVRDFEVLQAQPWHLLILDEAQYVKNPRAKVAQQVRRLDARHKLCMTGTPMENHLGELWAQFDFLMPGYLYDQRNFTNLFRKPIEKLGDAARQDALNLRIQPFVLRRLKEDVAAELPAKTEIIRSIDIEEEQRELYESVRLAMQKKVRDAVSSMGMAKSQIVVLDALLKMRQVCCDPRLLSTLEGKVPPSAKLEMLRDMLPEMVEEGRRILLFSQFTTMLKLIEDELQGMNIEYVKLTGQTRDRVAPVDRFQRGEVPVFLISLKAGG